MRAAINAKRKYFGEDPMPATESQLMRQRRE